MREKRYKRWRWRTAGLTLVEALVGSLLLGTLLVAILVAKGQLTVQARRAQNRLEACQVLDDLMESWWPKLSELPRQGTGGVINHPGWRWRTNTVPCAEAQAIQMDVVAVNAFAPGQTDPAPAAQIEIFLPTMEQSSDGTVQ